VNATIDYDMNTVAEIDSDNQVYYLSIRHEKFVPSAIFCLIHLRTLIIINSSFHERDDKSIYVLPPAISHLASTLLQLTIQDTPVWYLPNEFLDLKDLRYLSLYGTGLRTLPSALPHHLLKLTTLTLFETQITSLPIDMHKMTQLTYLFISCPLLTSLPTDFATMTQLSHISISDCPRLTSADLALSNLSRLSYLYAVNAGLTRLPRNLPLLTDLNLKQNQLRHLFGIEELGSGTARMKIFDFGNNIIEFVSEEIQRVKNLAALYLDSNRIRYLPEEIYTMIDLQELDLRNNSFNANELKTIAARFNASNPSMILYS
jgi:Leucine-rich repeat (LRR) protein